MLSVQIGNYWIDEHFIDPQKRIMVHREHLEKLMKIISLRSVVASDNPNT